MGYYTMHSFSVAVGDADKEEDYKDEITKQIGFNPWDDSCKWYECDNDMKTFSLKYPDHVFRIDGDGEDSNDIWTNFYKNGEMHEVTRCIEVEYNETMFEKAEAEAPNVFVILEHSTLSLMQDARGKVKQFTHIGKADEFMKKHTGHSSYQIVKLDL